MELKKQVEKRFPNKGTEKQHWCIASYIDPHFKGICLLEGILIDLTIKDIEDEAIRLISEEEPDIEIDLDDEMELNERLELSLNSKLRNKIQRLKVKRQTTRTLPKSSEDSAIKKEINM